MAVEGVAVVEQAVVEAALEEGGWFHSFYFLNIKANGFQFSGDVSKKRSFVLFIF